MKQRWTSWRERLRSRPAADFAYRIVVGVVGTLVLAVGIVAIPYPGPGWAIVFLGLAILASEFDFAKRALRYVRARYDAVMAWFDRQHIAVKGLSAAFTALIVVARCGCSARSASRQVWWGSSSRGSRVPSGSAPDQGHR